MERILSNFVSPFIHYQFQVQPNNYGTFYDSAQQNWSVLFKSPEDANKFAIHIALAKFGASEQNAIATLDTITGKGKVFQLSLSSLLPALMNSLTYNIY